MASGHTQGTNQNKEGDQKPGRNHNRDDMNRPGWELVEIFYCHMTDRILWTKTLAEPRQDSL